MAAMKKFLVLFFTLILFISCQQTKQFFFHRTDDIPLKQMHYFHYWDAYENFAGRAALRLAQCNNEHQLAKAMYFVNLGDYVTAARIYTSVYVQCDDDSIKYSGYNFINSLYSNNFMWDKLDSLNDACSLEPKDQGLLSFLTFEKKFSIEYSLSDTVGIRMLGGLPVITLEVENQELKMLLSTGSKSYLNREIVDDIENIEIADGSNSDWTASQLSVLNFGSHKLYNIPFRVTKNLGDVTYDGIIGWDILSKFNFTIDFVNETLALGKPQPGKNENRNLSWFEYPIVQAYLEDGTPLIFGINTGTRSTSLNSQYFETEREVALKEYKKRRENPEQYASTEQTRSRMKRGSFYLDEYLITCNEFDFENRPFLEMVTHGIIGTDIFFDKKIHFDALNGRFEIEQ
jgi:hypothetical protein